MPRTRRYSRKTRRSRLAKRSKRASRKGGVRRAGQRHARRSSRKHIKGGFLGFGSLKQGFSNLYKKVIGKKDEDASDGSSLPDVRTYPLSDRLTESPYGSGAASLPGDASSSMNSYGMQKGQGYVYPKMV